MISSHLRKNLNTEEKPHIRGSRTAILALSCFPMYQESHFPFQLKLAILVGVRQF